ncbi:hypothetical protein, partial [Tabrizicola oligotrophica]|uniref:hypothetical protein n=1 Tax=Tabrizicola oligotrophica TaxID=2710650 RepID=UPI001D1155C8
PILDLGHGIALELVCEFSSGHLVLLASKITKQGVYKSRGDSQASRWACRLLNSCSSPSSEDFRV